MSADLAAAYADLGYLIFCILISFAAGYYIAKILNQNDE